MELKVGMYLRHDGLDGDYPIIQKIVRLEKPGRCGGKYKVFTDKCGDWFIDSDYIELHESKYSEDILEVIDSGDWVNDDRVITITGEKIYTCGSIFEREDIRTIATKESIKAVSYEL